MAGPQQGELERQVKAMAKCCPCALRYRCCHCEIPYDLLLISPFALSEKLATALLSVLSQVQIPPLPPPLQFGTASLADGHRSVNTRTPQIADLEMFRPPRGSASLGPSAWSVAPLEEDQDQVGIAYLHALLASMSGLVQGSVARRETCLTRSDPSATKGEWLAACA